MANSREASMTRQSSSASSASSNIEVAGGDEHTGATPRSSEGCEDRGNTSTPPTSLSERSLGGSAKGMEAEAAQRRRSGRVRSSVDSYDLKKLADQQLPDYLSNKPATSAASRNVSGLTGRTLVHDEESDDEPNSKPHAALDNDAVDSMEVPEPVSNLERRPSVRDKVKQATKAIGRAGSVLGKRSRDMVEKGKDKLAKHKEAKEAKEEETKKARLLKELDTGPKGVLDEMDLDTEIKMPPSKRAKTNAAGKSSLTQMRQVIAPSNPNQRMSNGKRAKKWQTAGLYVGQDPNVDPSKPPGSRSGKLQKKQRPDSSCGPLSENVDLVEPKQKQISMNLPMFSYLERERYFTIPFDVFAPSVRKGDERPKDWHQLNRNRLIGDAKDIWAKEEKLARSVCMCPIPADGELGCDDQCLNRSMEYECSADNCDLGPSKCSNRAFSELSLRLKKGGQYDVGVEVVKTGNRGFGVRACRSYLPGQIIMEYTGEIITEEECQRRMREVYVDKSNFYLMEMERGCHIDGTKGSMARFINHSCAPNCNVRLVKVAGVPRMGVFAGEGGVMTGEELTYDYNFDNFSQNPQPCYCGAQTCRGYLAKKLNAAEKKKQDRIEAERRQKAQEEAMRAAEEAALAKKVRSEQDRSGWRGWVDLEDPETRKRIKAQQEEKRAKELSSERAKRMAARRSSVPASSTRSPAKVEKAKKEKSVRRKTYAQDSSEVRKASDSSQRALLSSNVDDQSNANPAMEQGDAIEDEIKVAISPRRSTNANGQTRPKHMRTVSTGSKFTEDLPRPASRQSVASTVTKRTELTITEATTTIDEQVMAHQIESAPTVGTEVASHMPAVDEDGDIELADAEQERNNQSALAVKLESDDKEAPKVSRKRSVLKKAESIVRGVFGSASGPGKLKQSTLNFARAS